MSDGFILWYERGWSASRAAKRVTELEESGLSASRHLDGQITAISGDWSTMGEQIKVDRGGLLRGVTLEPHTEFSFQYWLSGDTDVYCRVRRVDDGAVVHEFHIDGLETSEKRYVVDRILALALAATDATIGVVVDQLGGTEDEDWDHVVTGLESEIHTFPDVLGLTRDVAALHPGLAELHAQHVGELAIYDFGGLLQRQG